MVRRKANRGRNRAADRIEMTGGPIILGITGSIGVGKSTTADMFRAEGVPVWDADQAVHRLYSKGGRAVPGIQRLRPEAVVDGAVDRGVLSAWVQSDPKALKLIEQTVHPWLTSDRAAFMHENQADILGFDIPLLFETGADALADAIVVVTIGAAEQKRRVLERPGMTEEKLQLILDRQIPDSVKRQKADFVIETTSLEIARAAVKEVIATLRKRAANA